MSCLNIQFETPSTHTILIDIQSCSQAILPVILHPCFSQAGSEYETGTIGICFHVEQEIRRL